MTNKIIDTKKAENESDALTGIKIFSFQMTYPEFFQKLRLKEDKVIQSAINSGYPILNKVHYHKILNERT